MISGLMWYQRKTHHNVFSCCELFVVVSINDVNVNSGSASIFYKFNFIAAPAHNVSPDADRNKRTPILPASSRACHQLSSHHQYQTLWCLTPISIYFRQISLWISTQPLLSSPPSPHSPPLSLSPFSSSLFKPCSLTFRHALGGLLYEMELLGERHCKFQEATCNVS